MKSELQLNLYEKYPKIFRQKDLPMTETLMCWGIECGDGWYWLIDNLCHSIQGYCDSRIDSIGFSGHDLASDVLERAMSQFQVEAVQVKEKFGGLRFYISSGDDMVYGMIHLAEDMSYHICEECGASENVKQTRGWIKSLCPKCMEKLDKEPEEEIGNIGFSDLMGIKESDEKEKD